MLQYSNQILNQKVTKIKKIKIMSHSKIKMNSSGLKIRTIIINFIQKMMIMMKK
jgi:hypothetical protein